MRVFKKNTQELLPYFQFHRKTVYSFLCVLDEVEGIFGPETWLPDLWQTLPDVHSTLARLDMEQELDIHEEFAGTFTLF